MSRLNPQGQDHFPIWSPRGPKQFFLTAIRDGELAARAGRVVSPSRVPGRRSYGVSTPSYERCAVLPVNRPLREGG
ncbi:hypothetical protein J6590_075334 [Homalodisca vitripennis]|nr:hypothetical protein J6590_075334 [Homalodisca vitripennis]